ncbi:hypothetical protein RIF29_28061 [Crotalaria pallida]|uniref:F-box domain-containing protein n=1 Tax=Crotalaria pallida TaxID=3830 RepID=A0AAN9I108_CROPI
MVFKRVILQTRFGRKRKHGREDNFRCVQEGFRRQRIRGEEDSSHMSQSAEETLGEEDSNKVDQSVEGTRGEEELNQMDQSDESMDRISLMPDHIIHRILSSLRNVKDVVRTSVLSKRWRFLWYSFSILIFDERKFAVGIEHEDSGNKGMMFRDHVYNSLQTHLEENVCLQKLVLHMTSFDLEAVPHIDHWLSVVIGKSIKELDLHVGSKIRKRYTLPEAVLSSKTITGLRLSRCKLVNYNNIMLPNLQKLYLRKLNLFDLIVERLISNCPSIEDLRFIQCAGFNRLQISNNFRLKRVEIHYCNQLTKVEVSAPDLHTFWYCGKKSMPCKVSLEGCRSLKRLTLDHPHVTRDFFEKQIDKFPLLEKLDLSIPKKMKYIILSNPQLQQIALKGYNNLGIVVIDGNNLLSLEYKGDKLPHFSINPFCLTGAKLSFEPKRYHNFFEYGHPSWSLLEVFIKKFEPEGFKLILYSNKNIVIHEDLKNISLPSLPGLSVEIIKSTACVEDILYSLLRSFRPESISIISRFDSKFPELVYEAIKKKDMDPICCKYTTLNNKCWRHFLKDVKFWDLKVIEDLNVIDGLKAAEDLIYWLRLTYAKLDCQMAHLSLCWNANLHGVESLET